MSKNRNTTQKPVAKEAAPVPVTTTPTETAESTKPNSSILALIIVLVAAVVLIVVLMVRSNGLSTEVDDLELTQSKTEAELNELRDLNTQTTKDLEAQTKALQNVQADLTHYKSRNEELVAENKELTDTNNANKVLIETLTNDLNDSNAVINLAYEMLGNHLQKNVPETTEDPAAETEAPEGEPAAPEAAEDQAAVTDAVEGEPAASETEETAPATESETADTTN